MKKGDRVEFKTPSGKIVKGIYEGKTEQRAIIKGGKKTYKPPLKLVKKSKAERKKKKPAPKERQSVEENYKRHLKDMSSFSEKKLKELLKNTENRSEEYYERYGKNSDLGAKKAIKELLAKKKKPEPKEDEVRPVDKDVPKSGIVEIKLGDKKSEKEGRVKLSKSLLDRGEKNLDILLKDYTFAKAKKILMKDKVEFLKFLDKSNELTEPINDMVQVLNKAIQEDDITEAEARAFGNKMKRSNTARKKIIKLLKDAFDSKEEFEDTLKKAGIKTLKR